MSWNWQLRESDEKKVTALSESLGISKITARVLINRNIHTEEVAKKFLNTTSAHVHDPFLLKDMDRACERIIAAIKTKQKITIYGDYDVDGSVSTALCLNFFRDIDFEVDFYIPHRLSEGYSLNKKALDKLIEQKTDLIITVDNGIMAHEAITHANHLGLTVIVTDHHQVGDTLPPAFAVINPQRPDCPYPFKGICGAGVTFKLILALRQRLREKGFFAQRPEPNLKNYLDLLAIPTVCDVVPLIDENRYFVKEGLKHLMRTKRPGLRALLEVSGIKNKITATDLGFRIGPRLNACGRLEDASLGVKLLIAQNFDEAKKSASLLDQLNTERKNIEAEITQTAHAKINTNPEQKSLVVFDADWHLGVVGIVASRLVDRYFKPSFVLCRTEEGIIKGSGRSIPGVDLVKALQDCRDVLTAFGGHEAAAGVTLTEENIPLFQKKFEEAIAKQIQNDNQQKKIWVDSPLTLTEINFKLLHELEQLEPFGMGNPKPVFVSEEVTVSNKRIVGNKHVKLKLHQDQIEIAAIAFNKGEHFEKLQGKIGLLFGLDVNHFNGSDEIQMVVREFLPVK